MEVAATIETLAREGGVLLERFDCRSQSCRLELVVDEAAPLHARSQLVGELRRTLAYAHLSKSEGPSVELILSALDPNLEH